MFRRLLPAFTLILVTLTSPVRADDAQEARAFAERLSKQAVDTINGSDAEKKTKLETMFTQHVDIPWMAQFVLGRAWQDASQAQKDKFLASYKNYLLMRYTSNFGDYVGSKYVITDVKPEQDGQYIVGMKINVPDQKQETQAGYRVRKNGEFKIVDIIVEGVSLITTERSEFAGVVQQKGLDGLIGALDAKTVAKQK